jgi:hypothetical protein
MHPGHLLAAVAPVAAAWAAAQPQLQPHHRHRSWRLPGHRARCCRLAEMSRARLRRLAPPARGRSVMQRLAAAARSSGLVPIPRQLASLTPFPAILMGLHHEARPARTRRGLRGAKDCSRPALPRRLVMALRPELRLWPVCRLQRTLPLRGARP